MKSNKDTIWLPIFIDCKNIPTDNAPLLRQYAKIILQDYKFHNRRTCTKNMLGFQRFTKVVILISVIKKKLEYHRKIQRRRYYNL